MTSNTTASTAGERAIVLNYSPVDQERLDDAKSLKVKAAAYFDALDAIEAKYGRQRDFSLAKTHIQEASMWATRGLTNPE